MNGEEFSSLFVGLGFTRKVATLLACLANTGETPPRVAERDTGMPEPDVSLAIKYLIAQGWIEIHRNPSTKRGRPPQVCKLAVPLGKILDIIGQEKKDNVKNQLAILEKLKDFVR